MINFVKDHGLLGKGSLLIAHWNPSISTSASSYRSYTLGKYNTDRSPTMLLLMRCMIMENRPNSVHKYAFKLWTMFSISFTLWSREILYLSSSHGEISFPTVWPLLCSYSQSLWSLLTNNPDQKSFTTIFLYLQHFVKWTDYIYDFLLC